MKHEKKVKGIEKKVKDANSRFKFVCKHCGNPIDKVKLIGLSLICPVCGKPQNGEPHMGAC